MTITKQLLTLLLAIIIFSGCSSNKNETSDTPNTLSLSGQLPKGSSRVSLCTPLGKCQDLLTEKGSYVFNNIEHSSSKTFQLEVFQKGKAPYLANLTLHNGENRYNIDNLEKIHHLEYNIEHNYEGLIYVGFEADKTPYIDTEVHIGTLYSHVINSASIASDVTSIKIEIALQKNTNTYVSNKLLTSKEVYVKLYDQNNIPLQFSRPSSTPNRISSLVGTCNIVNLFYLDQDEDILLQDSSGDYIDTNNSLPGIQVPLYGYNENLHKWQKVGEGDYLSETRALKVCADYNETSVRIALPVLVKKPKSVCIQTHYFNTFLQSSPADNILLEAKGKLFTSTYTDLDGKAVIELFRDIEEYQFYYSDLATNKKGIEFVPSEGGECDYSAEITINTLFNTKIAVTVNDEKGSAYSGEYVWLYDELSHGYQSNISDTLGKVSFTAVTGHTYSVLNSSTSKRVIQGTAEANVTLIHKNTAPVLFSYVDNQPKLHIIGYDADSDDVSLNLTIDAHLQSALSREVNDKMIHWTFDIPLNAQQANIVLSDTFSSTQAPYYFQTPELNDVGLNLLLSDVNGEQVFSNALFTDLNYSIDVRSSNYSYDSIKLYLDDIELTDEKIVLQDTKDHVIKVQALFWFGVFEQKWTLKAQSTYSAPVIHIPLTDRYVSVGLEEQFEINVVDHQSEPLSYEWKIDGEIVSTSPLMTQIFTEPSAHNISVKVSNRYRSTRSEAHVISDYAKPLITKNLNPSTINILADSNATVQSFDISAADPYNDKLSYQWYVNGALVSTLKTMDFTFQKIGDYTVHCRISNQYTSVNSIIKKLHVYYDKPVILNTNLSPYLNLTLKRDNTLFVNAKDPYGKKLTYAWYLDGQLVSEKSTYTFTPQTVKSIRITLKVSNKYSSIIISGFGYINALSPIILTPMSYSRSQLNLNDTKQFNVEAIDPYGEELTYYWYSNNGEYLGSGQTLSYTFSNIDLSYLYCKVKNTYTDTNVIVYVDIDYPSALITKEIEGLDKAFQGIDYNFTVKANDPNQFPLTYSWAINNAMISGEHNTSFSSSFLNEGITQVMVTVSNANGNPVVSTADVNVTTPIPTFIEVFDNRTVKPGIIEHFEVLAEDFYNEPSYTWKVGDVIVGSDATLNYAFTKIGSVHLSCEVSNKYGKKAIHTATITSQYSAPFVVDTNIKTKSVHQGALETFYVNAKDPEAGFLHYEWYVNDILQDNNTSSFSYKFEKSTHENIRCTVLNAFSSVTSEAVITTIYKSPLLLSELENQTVEAGKSIPYTVTVSNPENDALTYQWYLDNVKVNSNTNTFTFQFDDLLPRTLKCIVSNTYRSVETSALITPEYGVPELHAPLKDINISFGQTKIFDVEAFNPEEDPLLYSWYINNILVSHAQTFSYTSKYNERFILTCKVENRYQSIESSSVVISVYFEPIITQNIQSLYMLPNQSTTFRVNATDPQNDLLTYQWYIDGTERGTGKSFEYTADAEIKTHAIWCKVSNKHKSVYAKASIAVTDSEVVTITTLPNAYVLLYDNDMNITSESQADINGIALIPTEENTITLGIVFGGDTVLDKTALHQFFIEQVIKEDHNSHCPSFNLINANKDYAPYLKLDEIAAFKGNDNYLNSTELYQAILYNFDSNNDQKLQFGELPSINRDTHMLAYAYIYHDIKTQSYTFLKVLPESNQLVEYEIANYNKCQAEGITLVEDQYTDYNVNSYYVNDDNLTTLVVIRDQEESGNILLALKELNISNASYVVEDFQNIQLESEDFTLEDKGYINSLEVVSNFNGFEFIVSNSDIYSPQTSKRLSLLKESDIGKRYLSLDSFFKVSRDIEEDYYVNYLSHNYIYLDPHINSIASVPRPIMTIDSNQTIRIVSLSDDNRSTSLEHTFKYDKDMYSSIYLSEIYTTIPNTVVNYQYYPDVASYKIEALLPSTMHYQANELFKYFNKANVYESINRIDYKEDNLTKVMERIQNGETLFDIGIKKLKYIFSDNPVNLDVK